MPLIDQKGNLWCDTGLTSSEVIKYLGRMLHLFQIQKSLRFIVRKVSRMLSGHGKNSVTNNHEKVPLVLEVAQSMQSY